MHGCCRELRSCSSSPTHSARSRHSHRPQRSHHPSLPQPRPRPLNRASQREQRGFPLSERSRPRKSCGARRVEGRRVWKACTFSCVWRAARAACTDQRLVSMTLQTSVNCPQPSRSLRPSAPCNALLPFPSARACLFPLTPPSVQSVPSTCPISCRCTHPPNSETGSGLVSAS